MTHTHAKKVKGQSVQKVEWKQQTNKRTDRQTDTTNRIHHINYAVGQIRDDWKCKI